MPDLAEIAAFRFGYGLQLGGLPVGGLPAGAGDAGSLMGQITGEDRGAALWPSYGVAEVIPVMLALREARGMDKAAKGAKKAQRRAVKAGKALAVLGSKAAMARAVSGDALRERLVRFWADHFTTVPKGRTQFAWPSAMETDAIRPHVAGRFGDMLAAVVTHPAMLLYLDQAAALGPGSKRGAKKGKGLNENLAREVLELHTLGVGAAYGQDDVRQLAELFTGLTVTPAKGFAFDEGRAEPGAELVLGVEYDGEGVEPVLAALQDLAVRPETARHIAGKLAVHFVSDTPDPGLVQAMAAVWETTGGDLATVVAAMLDHPAAWGERFEKARQPFDFMAASLRALGLTGDQILAMKDGVYLRMIQDPMKVMGQHWNHAPGPDGWPEAFSDWITPQGMAARIDWAMATPGLLVTPLPEAADVARAALGSRLTGALEWAIGAAESRREALGLVFAAPEFNRR